jgi:hypothetical protein
MAPFKALSPKVEVNGETVLSVVEGMGIFKQRALMILEENGINNPAPGQWYMQQSWLDAFKKISDTIGANTLFQIGRKIPESAKFPPEIDNIHKALAAIDIAYHMNHKGGEIGHYKYEKIDDHSASITCDNPYPCAFDKGIIQAMADKFKPKGSSVIVDHDPSKPCKSKGGDSCTYIVKW